jgi:hypothetical protein
MLKKAAWVFAIVFILIGVLGFIPGLTTEDNDGMHRLLGIFMVDGTHNVVHLLSGVLALIAAQRESWSRLYFQIFGIIYALVTVLGFLGGSPTKVLGFLQANTADHFLHLVIAAASLYLGFLMPRTHDEKIDDPTAAPLA